MPRKLRLAIDLDAILIDLMTDWLNWYNYHFHDDLTLDDMTSYHIENFAKKGDPFLFFENPNNYLNCQPMAGAREALEEFRRDGHQVIIATASIVGTSNVKYSLARKVDPKIKDRDLMIGSQKEVIFADVFIDDAPKNIVAYRNEWPKATIMTIAHPYNQDCRTLVNCFAEDHNNPARAWEQMRAYVRGLAA